MPRHNMSTNDYQCIQYIGGHPVLHRTCYVKGKQKKAPIGLRLNHGCNFMEVVIAVELLLLKDFPSLKAVIIPQTIRDDRVIQKKVYDLLAKMKNKTTGYFVSLLKDKAIHNGNIGIRLEVQVHLFAMSMIEVYTRPK